MCLLFDPTTVMSKTDEGQENEGCVKSAQGWKTQRWLGHGFLYHAVA